MLGPIWFLKNFQCPDLPNILKKIKYIKNTQIKKKNSNNPKIRRKKIKILKKKYMKKSDLSKNLNAQNI